MSSFSAAVEAGIKRLIYASTLSIFNNYPDDVYITELWKPLPSPEIVEMTKYLGELTAREFAREHLVTVTGLRLGELVLEEAVQARNAKPHDGSIFGNAAGSVPLYFESRQQQQRMVDATVGGLSYLCGYPQS